MSKAASATAPARARSIAGLCVIAAIAVAGCGLAADVLFTTYHPPCSVCFQYSVTVKYGGQVKTVGAVDGGTDGPAMYWQVIADLSDLLYPHRP
jgi:surface antigen